MNIEPGTRVRNTDPALPSFNGGLGTYVSMYENTYYQIKWDFDSSWVHLHTEDEFEVIGE